FHCAGNPAESAAAGSEYEHASARYARAAVAAGVPLLIQLSTVAVYGMTAQVSARAHVTTATPLVPDSAYARSRVAAQTAAHAAVAGSGTRSVMVRVPMVVGADMTSDALRLFFRTLRYGVFLHPGPSDAVLNCIGITRLCRVLAALARNTPPQATVLQFAD